MIRTICFAVAILAFSSTSNAEETPLPQWGATPPLTIDITAGSTANQYASVAMYRWDPVRQVGVRVETYAIPAYPMIPVGPPGSGGGGSVDPNSASGTSTDRGGATVYRGGTTTFPEIIVRAHRWWGGIGRIGYTLIDSYERFQALRNSNQAKCNAAMIQFEHNQCDDDDGTEQAPQTGCSNSVSPGATDNFVGNSTPGSYGIFRNACNRHSSCIHQVGVNRSSCDTALRQDMERQCNDFFPAGGFPGSNVPPSVYQNLNVGCQLQTLAYTDHGPLAGDSSMVALLAWYSQNTGGQALGGWFQADSMPASDAAWAEAQRQSRCKQARDLHDQFCN
jgi:hypothetical protein